MGGHNDWQWIGQRIQRLWPDFVNASRIVRHNFANIQRRTVIIAPGLFQTFDMANPQVIKDGGPVGDLMQWADLIGGLHALGYDVILHRSAYESSHWLRSQSNDMTSSTNEGCTQSIVSLVYTDISGYKAFTPDIKRSYKNRFRILDIFGTEAVYNDPDYRGQNGYYSDWGGLGLHLKQFYTLFPHTPDNTFLGYVVVPPANTAHTKKHNYALLNGKWRDYLHGHDAMLKTLATYLPVKATMIDIAPRYRPYVNETGVLSPDDYAALLSRAKLFVGLGYPIEGVGVIGALAAGAVILNPKRHDVGRSFTDKPTTRLLTSQSPYLEHFVGPPNVLTVDYTNAGELTQAIESALRSTD
jgi:alpha-1,3(6)-mannosylglycoprotein beta-1,6-N-acetyl-glucosaminyltransferase